MVADLITRLELQALHDRYVAAIDEDRLEEWPGFFTEDGIYTIISRENEDAGLPAPLMLCEGAAMMRDRVVSLRHANIYEKPAYRHFLSGLAWRHAGDETIEMTCSYLVVNTSQAGESEIYQVGRYEDCVVRVGGDWRFRSRRVVYDTLRVQTLLAYPI